MPGTTASIIIVILFFGLSFLSMFLFHRWLKSLGDPKDLQQKENTSDKPQKT